MLKSSDMKGFTLVLFDGRVKLTETVVGAEKVMPLILVKLQ